MTAESPRLQRPGANLTTSEGASLPTRAASPYSLPATPDNAPDQPAYWTGWHDGRASGLEVGWQRGHEAGQRAASVELAREWLAELAAESARLAAGTSNRRGPAWRALVLNAEDAA